MMINLYNIDYKNPRASQSFNLNKTAPSTDGVLYVRLLRQEWRCCSLRSQQPAGFLGSQFCDHEHRFKSEQEVKDL